MYNGSTRIPAELSQNTYQVGLFVSSAPEQKRGLLGSDWGDPAAMITGGGHRLLARKTGGTSSSVSHSSGTYVSSPVNS